MLHRTTTSTCARMLLQEDMSNRAEAALMCTEPRDLPPGRVWLVAVPTVG